MPATQELRSRSSKKASKKCEANQSVPSSSAKATRDLLTEAGTFTFSLSLAFRIFFMVRCISALYGVIQDCDEVFNYWEPMHYLQHGYGLQTWEYSPEFGIRSWAYILVHTIAAWFSSIMATNKLQVFYLLRIAFAAISSFVEARFYRTITEEINPHVGRYVFVALFFSAGMFNAATAFLPSTFAMWCTFMAYSYILRPPTHMNDKRTNYAVFWLGLGSLLGWPFSGAIGIPFLIEELLVYGRETVMSAQGHAVQFVRPANWRVQRLMRLAKAVAFSGAVISIPIVLIDWFFYRRPLFVPLNIVLYNVFGGEGQGPDIFGTEPWYYYIVNGFLNFNILFLFALGSAPLVLVASYVDRERVPGSSKWDAAWPYILLGLKLIPFYIWFGIFTLQPHKEERFLYVAYPFIALNAAISIFLIRGWTSRVARSLGASVIVRASIIRYISFAILAVFGLISVSRIVAVTTRYRAPITIYGRLWQERAPDQIVNLNYLQENYPYDASLPEINVCVGKEWFRYPGSYFLPGDARLQFIESDFKGMLPKPFTPEDIVTKKYEEKGQEYAYRTRQLKFEGARNAQIGFNSYNKADPLGYVDIDKCDYLVDADYPLRPQSPHEPGYIKDTKNWEIVACEPFLDAENSNQLSRAFFVPGSRGLAWGDYCLLKKRS